MGVFLDGILLSCRYPLDTKLYAGLASSDARRRQPVYSTETVDIPARESGQRKGMETDSPYQANRRLGARPEQRLRHRNRSVCHPRCASLATEYSAIRDQYQSEQQERVRAGCDCPGTRVSHD